MKLRRCPEPLPSPRDALLDEALQIVCLASHMPASPLISGSGFQMRPSSVAACRGSTCERGPQSSLSTPQEVGPPGSALAASTSNAGTKKCKRRALSRPRCCDPRERPASGRRAVPAPRYSRAEACTSANHMHFCLVDALQSSVCQRRCMQTNTGSLLYAFCFPSSKCSRGARCMPVLQSRHPRVA